MDAAYQNAIQKRHRLRQELERLDLFIAMYDELADEAFLNARQDTAVQTMNEREDCDLSGITTKTQASLNLGESPRRVTDNPKPAEVIEAVKAVLRERGQPLTRSQIREALERKGVIVRGANPTKVLGTMLWRSDEIETIENLGYWIKGESWWGDGRKAG
jgi:hypothetical protein